MEDRHTAERRILERRCFRRLFVKSFEAKRDGLASHDEHDRQFDLKSNRHLYRRHSAGLSARGLDGAQVKLADLHGQPAVLIFWTAWCPVCREEAPHFNELAAKYEPQGVHVIGINIQDSPARTEGGIKDFGIKYRVVRDADASVTRSYKVTGTPTILFLDRNGVVRYFGNELPADYSSRLDALVAPKGEAGE